MDYLNARKMFMIRLDLLEGGKEKGEGKGGRDWSF